MLYHTIIYYTIIYHTVYHTRILMFMWPFGPLTSVRLGGSDPHNVTHYKCSPGSFWNQKLRSLCSYYTVLYCIILYYTVLYYTILYYTILYNTILYTIYYILYTIYYILYTIYYTILYYTILYYAILYYTILYYTILYYTILFYTVLYYTIGWGQFRIQSQTGAAKALQCGDTQGAKTHMGLVFQEAMELWKA